MKRIVAALCIFAWSVVAAVRVARIFLLASLAVAYATASFAQNSARLRCLAGNVEERESGEILFAETERGKAVRERTEVEDLNAIFR
jgi:hypothetical protein